MKKTDPVTMPGKVQKPDKGGWVMASAIIPVILFWLGAIALRDFGAPVILTKILGSLCLIVAVSLMIGGMLLMRCPLCNHLNAGRYPFGTVVPYCRGCGVEFVERQYKLW